MTGPAYLDLVVIFHPNMYQMVVYLHDFLFNNSFLGNVSFQSLAIQNFLSKLFMYTTPTSTLRSPHFQLMA